ncbi:Hypothetical protein NTJ_15383 [Nesidiocoris tenuis]|uniref:DUF4773 domain-containing protein n=1 Tax=Nesidiocoris tenuis TaxID=355587 RepID=A0ABN7BDW6_9HEMI|nr:Hypothetical protein NTJ_15383 [Nesidiocoris tenuis]
MASKFFFLVFFGVVATAFAGTINWQEVLDAFDNDDSELESLEVEYDDSAEERGLTTNSKGENRCTCAAPNSCGCCARVNIKVIGKHQGCLNVTITPETKELEIFVDAIGKKVIGHKFSFAKAERVCDRLPGKLDAFKGCLYTDTTDLPDKSGIQTCTKIDFMKDTKIVAKIAFACVQFKDGQLSLNDNGDVKAKDLYSIKAGNPFKGFLNMVGWRQPSNKA